MTRPPYASNAQRPHASTLARVTESHPRLPKANHGITSAKVLSAACRRSNHGNCYCLGCPCACHAVPSRPKP